MLNNSLKVIEDYSKEVVRLARRNLNLKGFAGRRNRNSRTKSNKLSKGLGYDIRTKDQKTTIEFTSKEDYAAFLEEGVDGKKKKYGSRFKYKKDISNVKAFEEYIDNKPLRLRKTRTNSAGQKVNEFVSKTPENKKAAAFAMAKVKAQKGQQPIPFFGDAMNEAFEKLPPELANALVQDLEDIIIDDFKKTPNVTAKEI